MKLCSGRFLFVAASLVAAFVSLEAADKTWIGGEGAWVDPAAWSPAGVPALNGTIGTVLISGAGSDVKYDAALAGGDLLIRDVLTLDDSARWVQTNRNDWVKIAVDKGTGTLNIQNNATFDMGTSDQLEIYNGGKLNLKSGGAFISKAVSVMAGGNFLVDGGTWTGSTVSIHSLDSVFAGGTVTLSGQLLIHSTVNITGGAVSAALLQMEGLSSGVASPRLHFSGGHLTFDGGNWGGYYTSDNNARGGCVNFTTKSTGILTYRNCTVATARTRYFQAVNPIVRFNNEVIAPAELDAVFDIVQDGTSVHISLKQVGASGADFTSSCAVSDVSTISATLNVSLGSAGTPAADLYAFWGETAGGLTPAAWTHSLLISPAQDNMDVAFSNFQPALQPNKSYFARIAASNETAFVWAPPVTLYFITAPVTVAASVSATPQNILAPVTFTVSRPDIAACLTADLVVDFALSGSAIRGTHYTLTPAGNSVTIPAGQSSATLSVIPIANWSNPVETQLTLSIISRNYATSAQSTASLQFLLPELPPAPVNAFIGSVSAEASNPANWSLGVIPDASHDVVFSAEYAARTALIWDLPGITIHSLSQPFGASNLLTFKTTPDAPLTITTDATLNAGRWTHEGPAAAPIHAINLNIGGNLTVATGANINAGTSEENVASGKARGYYRAGPGYLYEHGASYGGEGSGNPITYGSVLNPRSYGSSGHGDNDGYSGGGLILLNVAGVTTLNGNILANGFGYTGIGNGWGASSGGTINLTTANLLGSGNIRANGGRDNNFGSGSGGRIRIKLTLPEATFDAFKSRISANGNDEYNGIGLDLGGSAAGTIALQTAADTPTTARVIVNNPAYRVPTNAVPRVNATHLPPKLDTDRTLRETTWVLENAAQLRLTKTLKINALEINKTTTSTPRLHLDGFDLIVDEFTCNGVTYSKGVYTSADLPAFLVGSGAVRVKVSNIFMLR